MQQENDVLALREWFKQCPAISDKNFFRVNYLPEISTEYAIYSIPSTIEYSENVLGEEMPKDIQTKNYLFASKNDYGADSRQNISVLIFYDTVIRWMHEQNKIKNFPKIPEGKIKSIVPTLTVSPSAVESNAATYEMQIKLEYRRY